MARLKSSRKRKVKRSPKAKKKITAAGLRLVSFDPQTGKKLVGVHVMTPSGLVMKVPKSLQKGLYE